jgi:hypothetical protein
MAGVRLNPLTNGPLVNDLWQTSIPGIFAGGNVVHVHDLADYVTESCESAAGNAIKYIDGALAAKRNIAVKAGKNIRYVVPNQIVTSGRTVSFYMRVKWPLRDATVKIGNICQKKFPFVRPSEQIRIDLAPEVLQNVPDELVINCEGEETV